MEEITPDQLSDYAAGVLPGAEREQVEAAVEADPELRRRLELMRRLDAVLPEPPPVDLDAGPTDEQVAAQDDLIARLSSERERGTDRLADARAAMVQALVARGTIRAPAVAEAMSRVDRSAFAPTCETPYDAQHAHVFSRDRDGRGMTSMSAPWVQALMLDRAALAPGASVLEIGSSGYNAALLRELVGADGHVATIDLDPGAVARTRAGLERTGYRDVEVLEGDGARGVPERGPFDAILVTAAAWDVPPPWWQQLTGTGRLVLPLRLLGTTRAIGLARRGGDHLEGHDPQVGGFVSIRGTCAAGYSVALHEAGVDLHVENPVEVQASALRSALGSAPTPALWTGVEVDDEGGVDDHLPLAITHPSVGTLAATEHAVLAGVVDRTVAAGAPVLVRGDSLAYRVFRASPRARGQREIGLVGHGPQAGDAIGEYVDVLCRWDMGRWEKGRRDEGRTRVEVWPTGAARSTALGRVWSQRPHCDVLVTSEVPR